MVKLPWSITQIQKILDGRLHSPIEDIVGDDWTIGSPLDVDVSTEYTFICNGNIRNYKSFPDHITQLWDTATGIASFSEVENTVEMVANIQFTFDPDTASGGNITLRVYVNESSPILMKSYTVGYKSATDRYTILATFYTGDDVGFDVKNNGVYFTLESTAAGLLYDPAIEIYRT